MADAKTPEAVEIVGARPRGTLSAVVWVLFQVQQSLFWLRWAFPVLRGLSCPEPQGILIPWPGIEPISPALEVKFLTTGPPGKSLKQIFDLGSGLIWFTI